MKKFFVILSRERGYRKSSLKYQGFFKTYYRKYPAVFEALLKRHQNYNQTLDELEELASQGQAFLVYPDSMPVSNRETDFNKLMASYQLGYAQGQKDLPEWKEFLGIK